MCYGDSGMEINWAVYGGAFCAGALATVLVQWVWGEVCWRIDRGSVVMPPTPVPTGGRSDVDVMGIPVPDYEGEDVVS
jgi:hypothetical protein